MVQTCLKFSLVDHQLYMSSVKLLLKSTFRLFQQNISPQNALLHPAEDKLGHFTNILNYCINQWKQFFNNILHWLYPTLDFLSSLRHKFQGNWSKSENDNENDQVTINQNLWGKTYRMIHVKNWKKVRGNTWV